VAGLNKKGHFPEKISPFLRQKMEQLRKEKGEQSPEYRAIFLQYIYQDLESVEHPEDNARHWEADMGTGGEHHVHGLERLYNQSAVIEPTMICAAHCRYCLRANYGMFTLEEEEIDEIARFCGSDRVKNDLHEVLVTGGDPLIVPKRLNYLVEALIQHAPNVRVIRIATRLPQQAPERIDNNVYEIFRTHREVRFEMATQTNHVVEFFPETLEKFAKINELGVKVYSQNVLMKGVNDNIEALTDLYRKMRECNIEPHYLFHCVPMKGMHHFRTTVQRGLELAKELVNSGRISGRVKPMYALMTDIGKITLYEGTILEKNPKTNQILLQSSYKYEDRLKWNPDWKLPRGASVDEKGYLRFWYLDGQDD
jgi:lysine 2,3-aminomutase